MKSIAYQIKRTLIGAIGYVYHYRYNFIRAIILPFIFLSIISFIEPEEYSFRHSFLVTVIEFIIYTQIAINTHRTILIGAEAARKWGLYIPSGRDLKFILYEIALLLMLIPLGFLSLIPNFGFALTLISYIYILGRLSLVFPAIATDKSYSFSNSWYATSDYQILMIVVVGIFPTILSIPELFLIEFPYIYLAVNFISLIALIFTIAALSVAFKVINEESS
jgi:hypothetical protein